MHFELCIKSLFWLKTATLFRLRNLLICIGFAVSFSGAAQLYTFENYNHRDGLITESTLSCAQDGNGYLWIGTDGGGLMRFDGSAFFEAGPYGKSFQYHVSSIYPDTDGTIYFTSSFDGLMKYKKGKYELLYHAEIRDGSVNYTTMIDSMLVMVTDYTLNIINLKGQLIRKYRPKSLPSEKFSVYQLLKIPQGVLLFTNKGNFMIRNKTIRPLESWAKIGKYPAFKARFATFSRNKLILYDPTASSQVNLVLAKNGDVFSSELKQTPWQTGIPVDDPVMMATERLGVAYLYTRSGQFYHLNGTRLSPIVRNYSGGMITVSNMYIDRNGDLWLSSYTGMFKISREPFTRVDFDPTYHDAGLNMVHITKSGQLLLSSKAKGLRVGILNGRTPFVSYPLVATHVSESALGIFVATQTGIYQFNGTDFTPVDFPYQQGKPITLIHWDGRYFWYSAKGEGLVRYDPVKRTSKQYRDLEEEFPDYFYTAENNFDRSMVYFGSNGGVYAYNAAKESLTRINEFRNLGAFSGSSTTDRYGTSWFTVDKAIVGITQHGDYVTITDPRIFPSTLFYTLTSDHYGNLLAGTNKGINVIEVDRNGHVVRHKNYSYREGFGGYETNMNAQFQLGNYSYVGTIEGLYLINTEVLLDYPVPPAPIIYMGRMGTNGELITSDDSPFFTFKCVLPKSSGIMYSYRIIGIHDKWSDFSFRNELRLPELANGEYVLEVRASYDGVNISEASTYPISIDIPVWRTKWFVVLLIVLLGVINIAYLEWSKSFITSNIFKTKDVAIDATMIPRIILFGFLVNAVMLVVADSVEPAVFQTTNINVLFSSLLLILFVSSRYAVRETGNSMATIILFYLAYSTLIVEDFILLYRTSIHPFPIFSIVMATSIIPFIASRIRMVIIISMLQLFASATMLIWIEETLYNEILFISAITISGGLSVMVTYLRNDSLEKLIFVNGVINKGNVMVISFDQKGIITYCSENISEFFNTDFTSVVGKPSSVLNPLIVTSEMRQMSLRDAFEDGRIILIPMYNKAGNVVWIEWSCKYFNESVRVIMGQDITEKVVLSNNYESLVENAQDMIFNTDIEGNFLFLNERCLQMFGYRNESLIGKNSLTLVAPEHRERVHQFYADQFKNHMQHTYLEFPIKSKEGRIFWVGQNVSAVYEPGSRKRIAGFIALARDITEKRANELLIEQQNKDITASINYAKRIQFNLLPDQHILREHFDQSFVLFKPKDIVSGDFYWMQELDDKLLLVLADCTGHGVPGAFMTLLGINLLNQIVRERGITEPDAILNHLNAELMAILPRSEGTIMFDGMDALIAVFHKDELCYASSGVSFIHNREGELILHRPEKHLGQSTNSVPLYRKECIQFGENDAFYLFTDGYQKQFGSIRNKKFSYKRMLELLETVSFESLPLQKKYFENAHRNWSEGHEQTDDITVIGLRGRLNKGSE